MEINEKKKKKEQQELIIRKYQQYLKLEKSLSPNTLEAYLTDLDKLMSFLTLEGINVLCACLISNVLQPDYMILVSIPVRWPVSCQGSNHSSVSCLWLIIWRLIPANCWKGPK